ncbi:hypothetical protein ACHQM5_010366 [Ranunculus cassubicifolius]
MEESTKKSEAIQEKKTAETLMKNQDYTAAREKLLRAKKLYPQLENINPMITVCNIHCAVNSQSHNNPDWYWVLQTNTEDNHTHIASKYRNLCKSIEPLKVVKCPQGLLIGMRRRRTRVLISIMILVVIGKPEAFSEYQIWAAYDDEMMPRRYAKINWIVRLKQFFEVGITWLKPIPGNDDEKKYDLLVREPTIFSHVVSRVQGLMEEQVEICPKKGEVWAVYEDWRPFNWCKDPKTRKDCGYLLVEIVMGYTKHGGVTIARLSKVPGFKSVFRRCMGTNEDTATSIIPANHLLKFSHNVPAFRFKGGEIDGVSNGMFELDPLAIPEDLVEGVSRSSGEKSSSDCSSLTDQASCKWSRKDFAKDQVWVIYDDPDSMPRRYVVVNNVISATEVCTTFLEPHPELNDDMYWVDKNLPLVCGLFRAGRTTIIKMPQFSHVVACEMNAKKSLYTIHPKKGEIWAMYKMWHPKWKKSDYQNNQCQIVEVVSDFSQGTEMSIASLVEVQGYTTFFHRQVSNGFELIRNIPRTDMLSFSHQIPCFVVPSIECHGLPKSALHLEPDALPRIHAIRSA